MFFGCKESIPNPEEKGILGKNKRQIIRENQRRIQHIFKDWQTLIGWL